MILKLISGKRYKHVEATIEGDIIWLEFDFDMYLKDEIKVMDGARWNKEQGMWSVKNNSRNWFQLERLQGNNPYKWYEAPLLEFKPRIEKLYPQQYKMAQEGLTYRQVIWAAEMGLGKTLAAIECCEHAMEMFGFNDWWWIGPKSALASFSVEVQTWGMKCYPEKVMTYDELTKVIKNWVVGTPAPQGVIFDEFSRCKNPTAQRTQAAQHLADSMRAEHGEYEAFIIGMTGTPAPKSPLDWYSLCEIVKPGFLREGNIHKFRDRLGAVVKKENQTTGGFYPSVLTWRDDVNRCKICGFHKDTHDLDLMSGQFDPHEWVPGVNEIAKLYSRMKGLTSVYFKRDWLKFLPEKQYRTLRCKVSRSTKNAAEAIKSGAKSAVSALIQLRELSDGFLYGEQESGTKTCELCNGSRVTTIPVVDEIPTDDKPFTGEEEVKLVEVECSSCNGTGEVPRTVRTIDSVGCPKDTLLEEILDDHTDDGRLVIYAGFTGSIDRIIQICQRKDWKTIRVDGRGWQSEIGKTSTEMLMAFQRPKEKRNLIEERVAFVAHPKSGGMGVTLTQSCETVYFSNDFDAESRIQSEDRIHRPGMDVNKGAMITDLVHLPSDELILKNLKEKRRLQDMSLGQFNESLKELERE